MSDRYANPFQEIEDEPVRQNFEALQNTLNELLQFVYWGSGAPGFTPPGRAVYINRTGGAATTLYVWEGAAWVGK